MADTETAETAEAPDRRRGEFLVNFAGKVVHYNPPWEDCNTDALDPEEKGIRSSEQMIEYKELGYSLCKKCFGTKQTWPRA